MAVYDKIGEVYDLVYSDTIEKIPFLTKLLKKHNVKNFLELGCGTGLFMIPLKKMGFKGAGIEISSEMIDSAKKEDPDLEIINSDITSYISKRKYDAVLGLSSMLALLKDYNNILKCLECTYKNLKDRGLFLIELPNHKVEIEKMNNTQDLYFNKDYSTIVVIKSEKTKKYWREYWYIFRNLLDEKEPEHVICEEMLFSPDKIKELTAQAGFEITARYGDLFGSKFDRNTSWREVLVCVKK